MRLPLNVLPYHYNIELKPDLYNDDPDSFTFSGTVQIFVECQKEADTITVHVNQMEVDNVQLLDTSLGPASLAAESWTRDEVRQFLIVKLIIDILDKVAQCFVHALLSTFKHKMSRVQ